MEDVIFAGTTGRASRNLAEVVITLSDTHGVAPPPFHEHAELEIQRRIERGAGPAYRINGKEARARDVQTLFADLASGARGVRDGQSGARWGFGRRATGGTARGAGGGGRNYRTACQTA